MQPNFIGLLCDRCAPGYGNLEQNCVACQCNPLTGQCKCKPLVIGRDCSHCEPGYWNLASGNGCESCNCNFTSYVSAMRSIVSAIASLELEANIAIDVFLDIMNSRPLVTINAICVQLQVIFVTQKLVAVCVHLRQLDPLVKTVLLVHGVSIFSM